MTQVTDEMLKVFTKGCWGPGAYSTDEYKAGVQALFDQGLVSLPVDEAAIRESVVREAIAMFEYSDRYHYTGKAVCENLRSILTPKDRAKELVDRFRDLPTEYGVELDRDRLERFARWLIEREG